MEVVVVVVGGFSSVFGPCTWYRRAHRVSNTAHEDLRGELGCFISADLQPAAAVEAGVGGEVAAVPATDVPLAEDDDERWFKTRWKTRHHTAANRALEE